MISVVVPTVPGREEYLARCERGYLDRTMDDVELIVIHDAETCGIAWQDGADRAIGDYIHFTADDIVPGVQWDGPLREAVDRGMVPCGLVIAPIAETLDPDTQMPLQGDTWAQANFFESIGGEETWADWTHVYREYEYPSVPFFSADQWRRIGPMIAGHYGTDKWIGHRARAAGIPVVVRHGAHFYHYAAHAGRVPRYDGWTHTDLIDFDLNIGYPAYVAGQLQPDQLHPDRGTPAGRDHARAWRQEHVR